MISTSFRYSVESRWRKRKEAEHMRAKEVLVVTGAGQISMAIARRIGYGKKIVLGDKNPANAKAIAEIMNCAGFDVVPMETDISSRESIRALRARVHRRLSTSFRQILLHTALKILAIRKYACKFLPCLQKNLLENPHIFPMNTSSDCKGTGVRHNSDVCQWRRCVAQSGIC